MALTFTGRKNKPLIPSGVKPSEPTTSTTTDVSDGNKPFNLSGAKPPAPAPSSSSSSSSSASSSSSNAHLIQWTPVMKQQLNELLVNEKQEVLLKSNPDRFIIYPIQFPNLMKHYEDHHKMEWVLAEVTEMHKDAEHYKKAEPGIKRLVSRTMAFFAASDGIVAENLASRFMKEVQIPEARLFYGVQIKMENIHALVYQTLLLSIISSEQERNELLHAARIYPSVQAKAEWAMQWIENEKMPFAVRILAFAIVEGIFFSSSFCSIYWLRRKNLFPATCKSNDWIARDEGLHCTFAIELFNMLIHRIPQEIVYHMFRSAVHLEQQFVHDILSIPLIGLSAKSMCQYVEFMADRLLTQAKYPKLYTTANPFEWMDLIGMKRKQNFHEDMVAEYSKNVLASKEPLTFGVKRKVQNNISNSLQQTKQKL